MLDESLEVEVSDGLISSVPENLLELIIRLDDTLVLGVTESVLCDVVVNHTSDILAGNFLTLRDSEEFVHLVTEHRSHRKTTGMTTLVGLVLALLSENLNNIIKVLLQTLTHVHQILELLVHRGNALNVVVQLAHVNTHGVGVLLSCLLLRGGINNRFGGNSVFLAGFTGSVTVEAFTGSLTVEALVEAVATDAFLAILIFFVFVMIITVDKSLSKFNIFNIIYGHTQTVFLRNHIF